MTTTGAAPRMPFDRPDVLTLAPLYATLRRQAPISPVRTPAGDPAWLVTRYDEAKALFADTRLGRSHPDPATASRISGSAVLGGASDNYETEAQDHARFRRLVVPAFSARRMRRLAEHVAELVARRVDALVAARDATGDGVVDLHEHVSFPVPVLVICELLGVPYGDREYFRDLSDRAGHLADPAGSQAAMAELLAYTGRLAATKRADPAEDLISDLVAAQAEDPAVTEERIAGIVAALLFAGHETTVTRIDVGTIMLLRDPAARGALVADPEGEVDGVVEEILRLASPGGIGIPRYAHADVEIGGITIRRGDAVLLVPTAANRDERAFPDPETIDPDRPVTHLGLGHGPHFCVGASLARTELRAVFAALFSRLPGLRLAVGVEDLELQTHRFTGGLAAVPVTW